jgi:hypothetical protein
MKWNVWGSWKRRLLVGMACVGTVVLLVTGAGTAFASGTITTVASTVPNNGDLNPYGVVVVPRTTGKLVQGDILVSNFNNSAKKGNLQGTGTTIVEISPNGHQHLFAHISASALPGRCPGGVGLTTALTIIQGDWVIVGSLPTSDGMADTAQAGCLIVLNRFGTAVETFAGLGINGPWDMTSADGDGRSLLFVTNVLNGTVGANGEIVHAGTVLRIGLAATATSMPRITSALAIGSGFEERTDPSALVIGPTGLGLGANDTLYVADSLENRIAAISDASDRHTTAHTGRTVSEGGSLNGPLGLTIAANGNILSVNGNDGNLVVTTPAGKQVDVELLDTTGAGTLFGLAVTPGQQGVYFVDDGFNTLNLFLFS